jgi:hypothetical protein
LDDTEGLRWSRSDGYLADYGEIGVGIDELVDGLPEAAYVTTRQSASDQQQYIILKVAPVPDGIYDISCEVAVMPRKMSALSDAWTCPVDPALHESVILPMARMHWMRNPYWAKPDIAGSVGDGYKIALDILLSHRVEPGGGAELVVG